MDDCVVGSEASLKRRRQGANRGFAPCGISSSNFFYMGFAPCGISSSNFFVSHVKRGHVTNDAVGWGHTGGFAPCGISSSNFFVSHVKRGHVTNDAVGWGAHGGLRPLSRKIEMFCDGMVECSESRDR
jgi:hypothetical protein